MFLNVPLRFINSIAVIGLLLVISHSSANAQETNANDNDAAIQKGVQIILSMQEGEEKDQWPYEGVYRVRGVIPIGYQVGGTAIAGDALILAPGYEEDTKRQEAVKRGATFIVNSIDHKLMAHNFESGYDVRGWADIHNLLGAEMSMASQEILKVVLLNAKAEVISVQEVYQA